MSDDLEESKEYFDAALAMVKSCGPLISSRSEKLKSFHDDDGSTTMVVINSEVEETIFRGLSKKYPTHKFIGEEAVCEEGKCELTEAPTWIYNPVDGTVNLVHGFPHSCISLALMVDRMGVIAIVYNPIMEQLFTAQKGKGAFLNGKPIHVSDIHELRKALITTETDTSLCLDKKRCVFKNYQTMVNSAHGIRSLGSAALNMSMVALGVADANYEFGVRAWDIAAGQVIVTEAGGVCIDPSGGPFDVMSGRVLYASSMELALEMSKKLYPYSPGRDGSKYGSDEHCSDSSNAC